MSSTTSASRSQRVLADEGYLSRANRAWLRERGVRTTVPERDDQTARAYNAAIALATLLSWIKTDLVNTPWQAHRPLPR